MSASLLRAGVVFPSLDSETARSWQAAVHLVARIIGGRVVGDVTEPGVDRNFHSAVVALPDGPLTFLLNTGARLVACVAGQRPFPADAVFVEVPAAGLFEELSLSTASASDLESRLTDADLAVLEGEEAEQARYHRPQRLGDLLFNWFD